MYLEKFEKGTVFVSGEGNILTIRGLDEAERIIADLEGEFKTFSDEDELKEFLEANDFQEADLQLNPEEEEDEEEEGEEDEKEPVEDEPSEKDQRIEKFTNLYMQMIELGSTGNDKIDKALEKLKKELSSELNTMTSEGVTPHSLYNQLQKYGYIRAEK